MRVALPSRRRRRRRAQDLRGDARTRGWPWAGASCGRWWTGAGTSSAARATSSTISSGIPARRATSRRTEPAVAARLGAEMERLHRAARPGAGGGAARRRRAPGRARVRRRRARVRRPSAGRGSIRARACPCSASSRPPSRLAAEGRLAESEAALRRLLAQSPGFLEARLKLGDVLLETGRAEEADDVFAAAAASAGASGDVWVALGEARLRRGPPRRSGRRGRARPSDSPTRAHELRARIALRRGDLSGRGARGAGGAGAGAPAPSSLVLAAEIRARSGDLPGALARLEEADRLARAMRLDGVPGLEFQRADALARLNRSPKPRPPTGARSRVSRVTCRRGRTSASCSSCSAAPPIWIG